MVDLGALVALRDVLKEDSMIQAQGVDECIHTVLPNAHATTHYPCVLLELEEIWSSGYLGSTSEKVRVRVKASTLSKTMCARQSMGIAERIRSLVDGRSLLMSNGKSGTVKLCSSVIEMPSASRPLASVQQYFDIFVA